ncbi:MAG TPA: hypothetical protein VGB46_04410 [Flavisolibacter sp.]
MKRISTLAALSLVLFACTNNNKTAEIAEDVCGCFEPVTEDMSSRTKKILVKAFNDDSPQEVIATELNKIKDEDERAKVTEEMQAVSNMGSNAKVEKCVKNLKKKYKVKDKDKKMAKEIANEMQDVDDCDVAAAMMKMASRMEEERGGDDEEATDDETTDNE